MTAKQTIEILLQAGLLKERLSTGEAMSLLKDRTPITINQIQRAPKTKQALGAQRYGQGRNYSFSTKKVLSYLERNY